MQPVWILPIVLCQLLTAPVSGWQEKPQPPADAARRLAFNWPDGLVVRVETERSREQTGVPNPRPAMSFRATYRMRVLPHDAGVLIRFDDFDRLAASGKPRVRLELGTMLPHELTSTKTVTVRVSAADGTSAAVKQVERRTSSFSY